MKNTAARFDVPARKRRSFLKNLGLAGGAVFFGSFAENRGKTEAAVETQGGRRLMLLLHSSDKKSVNEEFVKVCNACLEVRSPRGMRPNLSQTVARICHYSQVYFKDVEDAKGWLEKNGYQDSLDYYVSNGGQMAVIFNELDRVSEPQYGVCRRSLAYLAYALRTRYTYGRKRLLYTMFPGPSERLGPNGFSRYFGHYDMLADGKGPQTFGEVYGENVDPLLFGKTMLNHGGKGVFDRVALRYGAGRLFEASGHVSRAFGAIPALEWFKANVDDSVFLYQAEGRDAGTCRMKTESPQWREYVAGRALAPYAYEGQHYYFHLTEQS